MFKLTSGLVLCGLVMLSFFGAAMSVHGSGHSSCLAVVLQNESCPPFYSAIASALFHSKIFASLFSIIITGSLLLGVIVAAYRLTPPPIPKLLLTSRSYCRRLVLGEGLIAAKRARLFSLSLLEHSPTV